MHKLLISARSSEYIPVKANPRDAGYDLKACLQSFEPVDFYSAVEDYLTTYKVTGNYDPIFINGSSNSASKFIGRDICLSAEHLVAKLDELVPLEKAIIIAPGKTAIVSAGFKVRLPRAKEGYVTTMQVYPRSGLGIKSGLILANSVGIIDESYVKDEVKLGLHNSSSYFHIITDQTRVAQALIVEVLNLEVEHCSTWEVNDDRGGGLGSSGV